jgi:hypothetical protein
VKVLSPEICIVALGERLYSLEASIAACAIGEDAAACRGRSPWQVIPTDCIGTWESHVVPYRNFQQAEEARRRYGDMAVGLTHSRGVVGVMPDAS